MTSTQEDSHSNNRPFYLRGKVYLFALLSTLAALAGLLVLSVLVLRWVNPPTTSFMLQQDWQAMEADLYSLRGEWTSYSDIPAHSMWAVVGAEDQLFWEHWGFDFESIQEAWEDRQEGTGSRGASSITQQVAKNLYLWPAESFFRKGVEAGITLLIELLWPKERIIEVYLNIAEFGPGVFGIGKAADHFFDRRTSQLEPDMSARLAAVLPSPKRMRVNPPSPYARERSRWILRQMTQLSGIAYVRIDSTKTNQLPEAQPADSSARQDTIISIQSVNSLSLTGDSLSSDSTFSSPQTADSLVNDSLSDSSSVF